MIYITVTITIIIIRGLNLVTLHILLQDLTKQVFFNFLWHLVTSDTHHCIVVHDEVLFAGAGVAVTEREVVPCGAVIVFCAGTLVAGL